MMAKSKEFEFLFTPKEVPELIPHLLDMEQWCKQFREFLALLVDSGQAPEGVSLEATAPTRKWDEAVVGTPEALAKKLLPLLKKHGAVKSLDEIAPRSAISPSQLEKMVGTAAFRADFAKMVRMHSTGNLTLRIQWPPTKTKSRGKSSFGPNPEQK